jgi:hypothetical protein
MNWELTRDSPEIAALSSSKESLVEGRVRNRGPFDACCDVVLVTTVVVNVSVTVCVVDARVVVKVDSVVETTVVETTEVTVVVVVEMEGVVDVDCGVPVMFTKDGQLPPVQT